MHARSHDCSAIDVYTVAMVTMLAVITTGH
jgi:hypothetical protein